MGLIDWLSKKSVGPDRIALLKFYNNAKADKIMDVIGGAPDSVIADAHTAAVNVGQGSLCRVFGTAGTDLIAFGPNSTASPLAIPTTSTQNAVMLSQSCMIIVATDDFIRTTTGVTRVEVFKE